MRETKVRATQEAVEQSFIRLIESHRRAVDFYEIIGRSGHAEQQRAAAERTRALLEQWRSKMNGS